MSKSDSPHPTSAKLKKAIKWLSETMLRYPDKNRVYIIRQAEIQFDLTPKECTFLDKNFCK